MIHLPQLVVFTRKLTLSNVVAAAARVPGDGWARWAGPPLRLELHVGLWAQVRHASTHTLRVLPHTPCLVRARPPSPEYYYTNHSFIST